MSNIVTDSIFWSAPSALGFFTLFVFASLSYIKLLLWPVKFPPGSPRLRVRGLPILGSVPFFTRRWEWFRSVSRKSKTGNFCFNAVGVGVIGMSGVHGRQSFYGNPHFDSLEGYATMLTGGSNTLESSVNSGFVIAELEGGNVRRRIIDMLKPEKVAGSLEYLMQVISSEFQELGDSGVLDPFDFIRKVVFNFTIHLLGCKEISDDPKLRDKVAKLLEAIDPLSGGLVVLMPWFPAWSKVRRLIAATRLYLILKKIVDGRKSSGKSENDPLQAHIDDGLSTVDILKLVVGAIFSGWVNSGIQIGWLMCHLLISPRYLSLVKEEISQVTAIYNSDPTLPLAKQIRNVPISAWESNFPTIERCLKECIRVHGTGVLFRKNLAEKDQIVPGTGEIIPKGCIMAYHTQDVHFDEEIYSSPLVWDPERFTPGREEDTKSPMGFIGWGAGRHPCLGMKFAKLECKLLLAFFIATFDSSLVSKRGLPLDELPPSDVNAYSASKPLAPVYVKYSRK